MQIPTVKAGATTRTGLQHTPHANPLNSTLLQGSDKV